MGDGEVDLIHFLKIGYQDYSNSIRNDLIKIIKNYRYNSKYILMIPIFVNYTNAELKKANRFSCFLPLKITFGMIFNKKAKYFDAHAFYRDNGFKDLILPCLQAKKTIVVTNENE